MKKDVLLIANYWHFFFEKKSSRYRTMADTLVEHGFDVDTTLTTIGEAKDEILRAMKKSGGLKRKKQEEPG